MSEFEIFAGEVKTGSTIKLAIVKVGLTANFTSGGFKLSIRRYFVKPFYYGDDKKEELAQDRINAMKSTEPEELLEILEEQDIRYSELLQHFINHEIILSEEVSMNYYNESFEGEDGVLVYFEDVNYSDAKALDDINWEKDPKLGSFLESMRLAYNYEEVPAPIALFLTTWLEEYVTANSLDDSMEAWVAYESYRLD